MFNFMYNEETMKERIILDGRTYIYIGVLIWLIVFASGCASYELVPLKSGKAARWDLNQRVNVANYGKPVPTEAESFHKLHFGKITLEEYNNHRELRGQPRTERPSMNYGRKRPERVYHDSFGDFLFQGLMSEAIR